MGKHRTAQQDAIFVAFMERHPIIAKNYYKGDKLASEAAWKRLSKELNSVGPPVKESGEWKRVWKDWKNGIRKKIANNRLEPNATGKSSLYQDTLTPLEDAVATITDLYEIADVIVESQPKSKVRKEENSNMSLHDIKTDRDEEAFENDSEQEEDDEEEDDDDGDSNESISIQNVGVKMEQQMHHHSPAKKRKLEHDTLNGSFAGDKTVLMDIAKELRDLNRQTRLNAQRTEANTEALLAMGTQISDLMQQQLKERKRLNAIMEKFMLKMETTD
ncbi:uncharacterized protein LOC133844291 isoform X2 [Drosophila sulfurigaster albostrigata]|uniref:Regulatory protein zeste n=1 Tax=Drosophila albomicans TaxID=7291 RepID=A0A6P8WL06_DROAB|nr:uncharacterized protein LOC117568075 isoform X2 [Drosophila albomicans]XP_060654540.1 uncharacterized protein LOC132790119 isoform X2 [Drosophila nasuta]XP_062134194.1 uncharacterized protein LOC133844291 isoform X2 [Drosophila sulfurigaster albostrigata]